MLPSYRTVTSIERELQMLEAELRRLEAEYSVSSAARLPRPPWETRQRVEGMLKRVDRMHIPNYGHKFKFNTLQSRFTSFVDLWDRGLRSHRRSVRGATSGRGEAGQGGGHRARRARRSVQGTAQGDGQAAPVVRDQLAEMRRQTGQDAIPFHKFADLVNTQVTKMKEKGSPEVAFRVTMKEGGKVAFTARGKRNGRQDK